MGDFIVDMLNEIIKLLGGVISLLFVLFPNSPFGSPTTPPKSVNLSWVTWIFDFPTWIKHFSLILIAIGFYYIIRVAARWAKVVKS